VAAEVDLNTFCQRGVCCSCFGRETQDIPFVSFRCGVVVPFITIQQQNLFQSHFFVFVQVAKPTSLISLAVGGRFAKGIESILVEAMMIRVG
jgi:hypothetical protein